MILPQAAEATLIPWPRAAKAMLRAQERVISRT
jgi:hypothetical protein